MSGRDALVMWCLLAVALLWTADALSWTAESLPWLRIAYVHLGKPSLSEVPGLQPSHSYGPRECMLLLYCAILEEAQYHVVALLR